MYLASLRFSSSSSSSPWWRTQWPKISWRNLIYVGMKLICTLRGKVNVAYKIKLKFILQKKKINLTKKSRILMGNLIRIKVLCKSSILTYIFHRLTSSCANRKIGARFHSKIIKSFNKKKTFCVCIAHTKGYHEHRHRVSCESSHKHSDLSRKQRIFDMAQFSFFVHNISILILNQL